MLSAFGNGQISPKRYIQVAYKWGCRSMRTPSALIGLIMLVGSGFASAVQGGVKKNVGNRFIDAHSLKTRNSVSLS
jgi:hypothetical protein